MAAVSEILFDVTLGFQEWKRVNSRPLFFLRPSAVQTAISAGINVERIYKNSAGRTRSPLGRDAIARALNCQPTLLAKADDIRVVINNIIPGTMGNKDIISAIFAIRNLKGLATQKRVSIHDLVKKSGYSEDVIGSIMENYRVTLSCALKVCSVLGVTGVEEIRSVISVANGDRFNVKNVGSSDQPRYVLNSENLLDAPTSGHPWC